VNCLNFRRRWLTVPGARDIALAQHERVCSGCRQFARRGSEFERKLREALSIEVPADLAERIRQRWDSGEQAHKRQLRPLRYALVATLLLVVGLASLFGYEFLASDSHEAALHRTIVQHINGELDQLYERNEIGMTQVGSLFARFGAELQGDLSRVAFARACRIGRHDGVHMVFKGRRGPVTVFYMDGAYVEDQSRIDGKRFTGVLLSVDAGSIAVVGERGELLAPVVERLKENLHWGI